MNRALAAAAGSSVLVGAGIVASRFALAEVGPLTLAMLRYAIGAACLAPPAWRAWRSLAARPALPPRDVAAMALLGVFQFGVLIALLNLGLRGMPAAEAALIFSLFPLITLALAVAMGRERFRWPLLAGVLVSIAGVALSFWPKLRGAHEAQWWSEAAVLAAATVGALCSVLYRPYLQRYPTLPVSALAMAASVATLAAAAWPEGWPSRIPQFSAPAWAAIAFVGVSSAIGYSWWLHALKHESPTRVTVFLALNPLTAAVLGMLLLQEPVQAGSIAAVVLVGAGLWMATR